MPYTLIDYQKRDFIAHVILIDSMMIKIIIKKLCVLTIL